MNKVLILFIFLSLLLVDQAIGQSNQVVSNGTLTNAVNFGTGCSYSWTNDNPAIGLPAIGSSSIPAFTAVNTGTVPITATITATPLPGGFVYISNADDNTMSVIRIADNAVVATIPVQSDPSGVSVTADGSRVFVSNSFSRSVSMIDAVTNMVIKNIPVVDYSISIRVNKDGSRLYVANYNNRTVSVINTATNVIIATIPAGFSPYNICISPDGSRLYITNNDYSISTPTTVTVINTSTNTLVTQITVGVEPEGITINKDGSRVYVANMRSGTVSVINTATNTVTETIPVGGSPHDLAVSPDGKVLYTRDQTTNQLIATNLLTKVAIRTNVAGVASHGIDVSADGLFVYISNHHTNNVSVVNTVLNTEVAIIAVGRSASSTGEFVTAGIACQPITFTITVNPAPSLTIGPVTGNITACAGVTSTSTQQFQVSGTYLTGSIVATAPPGFMVSRSANGPFGNSTGIVPVNGTVDAVTVYVKTGATSTVNTRSGNVTVSSAGIPAKTVTVSAFVDYQPMVNALPNLKVKPGATVSQINFSGTADQYRWANNAPGIGLAAGGTGNYLSAFTATSNSELPVVATISAIPVNNSECEGIPILFTITVENDQVLTVGPVSGTIAGCFGVTSTANQQFQLSGRYLKDNVTVNAPPGFEVSTTANSGYAKSKSFQPVNGLIAGTLIYVRSAANAAPGVNSGEVTISAIGLNDQSVVVSSTINAAPVVNAVSNQQVNAKNAIYAINFTGTAEQYTWTNSAPAIGLAASGTGNIGAFTAINTSDKRITATITVVPVNSSGCQGASVSFSINVDPEQRPAIMVPNIFTPNSDGINDTWTIQNINDYPKVIVKVFNRLGAVVFFSQGYPQPWNGKSGDNNIPVGTYYYLIDTSENKVISGYVTIMR
jgi:gliding motility-associated-like protein